MFYFILVITLVAVVYFAVRNKNGANQQSNGSDGTYFVNDMSGDASSNTDDQNDWDSGDSNDSGDSGSDSGGDGGGDGGGGGE